MVIESLLDMFFPARNRLVHLVAKSCLLAMIILLFMPDIFNSP